MIRRSDELPRLLLATAAVALLGCDQMIPSLHGRGSKPSGCLKPERGVPSELERERASIGPVRRHDRSH